MIGLKDRLGEFNSFIKVIAKVEKPEALQNLDGIVEASDGVMAARETLEIPQEQVPWLKTLFNLSSSCQAGYCSYPHDGIYDRKPRNTR